MRNRYLSRRRDTLLLIFCIAGPLLGSAFGAHAKTYDGILTADSLPATYGYAEYSSPVQDTSQNWWSIFNDDTLSRLEQLALTNNYSAKAALKSIEASRQLVAQARAGYFPTIDLSAGYTVTKPSGKETKPYGATPTSSWFQAGASLSWEIDIFGRVSERMKAQKAGVEISRLEYEGLQLSLSAEVANDYFTLLMYRSQLNTAQERLKSQEEVLAIVESRYTAGLVSKLDVAQARSMVSSTRLLIPTLEAEIATERNAIALLCGVSEGDIANITTGDLPANYNLPVNVGVPADLIRRRPDVAEAEKRIESLADNLGIARKDYLPSLTLNASIGTSAHNIKDMFGKHSFSYEVAPTLSWTLFDGLSRRASVAEAKAEMEAQIEDYNNTLATAVMEVQNSLALYQAACRQSEMYSDILANDKEMVNLALARYRQGLADFSDVADAQITWMTDANSYDASRTSCLTNLVSIYKAIGGSL